MAAHRAWQGAFAGLWDEWHGSGDAALRTFTILTTTPNDLMSPIHARMPVILRPEQEAAWLDTEANRDWQRELGPFPSDLMAAYPVSARVNSPRYDDSSRIEPLAATDRPLPLGL